MQGLFLGALTIAAALVINFLLLNY
jgi:hypothetical protein